MAVQTFNASTEDSEAGKFQAIQIYTVRTYLKKHSNFLNAFGVGVSRALGGVRMEPEPEGRRLGSARE